MSGETLNSTPTYPLRSCSQCRRQEVGGSRRKLCHCSGCKPLCPGRQSVISFCYEARVFRISGNSTILRNNRGQFCRPWNQMAGSTKQIFKNFPGVIPRTPLRDGATHSTPIASTTFYCALDSTPQCWEWDP